MEYNVVWRLEFATLLHLGGTLHGRTQFDRRVLLLHVTIHFHDLLVPVGRTFCDAATSLALATFLLVALVLLVTTLLLAQAAGTALLVFA